MEVIVSKNLKKAYSDQYSADTAEWRRLGAKQKFQNIIDITAGFTFEKILEVGAGDGSILELISQNNFCKELSAMEISESGIKQIENKKINNLKSIQLFDGYNLPFDDSSFDLVILTHVLEHVEHERILLREIHRVAKMVLIEVPKDYRYGAHRKYKHFLSYGHINLYTPTSLFFLLLTEKFKIINSLTRVYQKDTFLFGKKSIFKSLKALLTYYSKLVLINTPLAYINHKFINTITVLVVPEKKDINIF